MLKDVFDYLGDALPSWERREVIAKEERVRKQAEMLLTKRSRSGGAKTFNECFVARAARASNPYTKALARILK